MDKTLFNEIFDKIKRNGTKKENRYILNEDSCYEYSCGKVIQTKEYGNWEIYNNYFEGKVLHKLI